MCAVNSAGVFSSFECDKTNNEPKFSDALALNMSRIAEASMLGFQFVVESFLLTATSSERQSPNVKAERVATGQEMLKSCALMSTKFIEFFNQKKAEISSAAACLRNEDRVLPPISACQPIEQSEPAVLPGAQFQNVWSSSDWEQRVSRRQFLQSGRSSWEFQLFRRKTYDAYVSGIPWKWGANEMFQMFRGCGKISQIFLPTGIFPGTHRGFCFVRFEKTSGLENALALSDRKVTGHEHLCFRVKSAKEGRKTEMQAVSQDQAVTDPEKSEAAVSSPNSVLPSATPSAESSSLPSPVSLQQPVWVSPMETEHGKRVMDNLRNQWAQRRADAEKGPAVLEMNKLLFDLWNIDDALL